MDEVFLNRLKESVTSENVNQIPVDWESGVTMIDSTFLSISLSRGEGFLHLSMRLNNYMATAWILDHFKKELGDLNSIEFSEWDTSYPLLVWCARKWYNLIPLFVKRGVRKGGLEAVDRLAKQCRKYGHSESIMGEEIECLLKHGLGISAWIGEGPRWLDTMMMKYRWRLNRCKSIVVNLLGIIRFRRPIFHGMDRRMLRVMIVNPIWESRCTEHWDFIGDGAFDEQTKVVRYKSSC